LDDIQLKVKQLQGRIAWQEAEIAKLENEIHGLEQDLKDIEARYQKLIEPLIQRLEAVYDAIEELERERRNRRYNAGAPLESEYQLPTGYISVEEQYRRVWENPGWHGPPRRSRHQPQMLLNTADDEDDPQTRLKKLYRRLARLYHPDLAATDADRQSRNDIMALINDAYAQQDFGALEALAEQPEDASQEMPLAILNLRRLQQRQIELDELLLDLKRRRERIINSEMMKLHIEEKTLKLRRRDLLKEMAAELEQDYYVQMQRLQELRRGHS